MRAGIVGELADHPAFAAVDDHVGHRGRQVSPSGNGEQVFLPLVAGNLDQRFGSEPAGLGQHAAGDLDLVVPGQMLNHLERRVVDRRQPFRELGLGPRFDARNQKAENVVEDLDLVVAETVSVIEKEIGHLSQGIDPAGRRTASDGVFEFGYDRVSRLLHHCGQPVCCFNSRLHIADRRLTPALKWNRVEIQNDRCANRQTSRRRYRTAPCRRRTNRIARVGLRIALPSLLRRTQRFT